MRAVSRSRLAFRYAAATVAALATLLTACAIGPEPQRSQPGAREAAASRHDADALLPGARWIATANVPEIAAYANPNEIIPTVRLANPDANGTPRVFLVDTKDAEGEWLPVPLPIRPNGTKGWIRSADVTLSQTQYRIKVDLTAHKLTVFEDREVALETAVGVGKETTPTPPGSYYIKELIQPPDPNTVYGPYVFGLSGYSNVLTSLNGQGEGVIGIHGNNDPKSIGNSVSSGCIRLPNDVIAKMTQFLPLGTPVKIVG